MTTWAGLGLPAPLISGYSYRRDAGLSRTPFAAPLGESGQIRTGAVRSYQLAWGLDAEQLALAEGFLQARGFTWFEVCMASGLSPEPVAHEIRLTSDWQTATLAPGVYRLTASAEARLAATPAVPLTCDSDLPAGPCA